MRRTAGPERPYRAGNRAGNAVWLGALALALRIPAFFASRHLTFDDGVFGASALAMRHGGRPFREVFSSQGPLFLPLVWVGDLLGLRTQNAPRVIAVLSGVAITLLVYVIGRRLGGHGVGLLAALVTTVSGSVLWTSGPLAADGPGLALTLAAVAVALAYRDAPSTRKALAFGALIAAAFTVKSLLALPGAVVVAWVLLEQREGRKRAWRHLALALATSAIVVLALSLPWGLAGVWDQAVDYHLDAAGERTPGRNFNKIVSTLWDRDLLAMALGMASAVSFAWSRVRDGRRRSSARAAPVIAWFLAVVAVLVLEHPLWRPHLAHLVPPLALLGAYGARNHLRAVAGVLALVAVGHLASNTGVLWPAGYEGADARAAAALDRLPEGAFAISDEPGFVWRAGLRTPDDLVDTSILRIDSGRISARSLAEAARDDRVCAVLVWSHRFARFDLGPRLGDGGYEATEHYGHDRVLYLRPPCR